MPRHIVFITGLLLTIPAWSQLPAGPDKSADGVKIPGNGYFIHLSISNLAGRSSNEEPDRLSIHLLSAYKTSKGLSFGAGSGIDHLEIPLLPFYAYLRYDPFKTKFSPYVWLKSGYAVSLAADDQENTWYGSYTESKGGLLLNAGIGFVLYTWPNIGINMGVGYRFQKVSETYHDYWWGGGEDAVREIITEFNRFELQLGIIFR
ncbi:MAG: hypothetical protein JW965_05250 [Bacteroidales bacterium]|nr:hypothetical protein [Bacteroidales bacterium]